VLTGIPRRIVMGGGVMDASHLFPRVRAAMTRSLNGYIALPDVALADSFVVAPSLGGNAGPLGAIVLGGQALADQLGTSFTTP
jgi:fructokinase